MSDPREEAIRAAYDAARFDERTPDEKGFAELFDKELKPKFIASVAFNLRVDRVRRRRWWIAFLIQLACLLIILPPFLKASLAGRHQADVSGILAVSAFAWLWALGKRPSERDPNREAVVNAVAGMFGARLVKQGGMKFSPERKRPPIQPPHTSYGIRFEHLEGRFDGRLDFAALWITATKREFRKSRMTFQGWYVRVDLPHEFSGKTVIRTRTPAQMQIHKGLQDVSLESAAFMKRFIVLSDDQVEARVILAPDVMQHLISEADAAGKGERPWKRGDLMLGFSGRHAHIWLPAHGSALFDWRPLDPAKMIQDLHETFAELSALRKFLRDIDVIAESEGFRAQAARNTQA